MSDEALAGRWQGRPLMLFDGQCGFCHRAVQWVVRHDAQDRFRFAPQASDLATAMLARFGLDREALLRDNSVYLILGAGSGQERLLTQSDVTVNLLLLLGGRWRILGRLLGAVPSFLRNAAYRFFARNRYRIGGRYEVCPVPTEAERIKFLA